MQAHSKTVRRVSVFALVVAMTVSGFATGEAQAKRLGGGGSIGKQSRSITPSSPAPAPTGTPMQKQAQPAPANQPAQAQPTPTAPAPQRNRWLGPLAGLAAGVGLAALFSHFGMGEALASLMGNLLIGGLVVFAVLWLIGRFRKNNAPAQTPYGQPAYGMAGGTDMARTPEFNAPTPVLQKTALNDASTGFGHAGHEDIHASSSGQPVLNLPADFNVDAFLSSAKKLFVQLQAAYDKGDLNALKEYTSDDMWAELKQEIAARGSALNVTDVVTLEAQLLAYELDVDEYIASVVFTGMLRETLDGAAEPFEEVWNMARPADGKGGWVLAGVQSL